MANITRFVLTLVALLTLALAAVGCGNSSTSSLNDPSETVATATPAPQAIAVDPAATSSSSAAGTANCRPCEQADASSNDEPARASEVSHERARTERARRSSRRAARRAPVATDSESGLGVRRLVVATDIEDREPVGASERFGSSEERLFAFVEAVNESNEEKELVVVFVNEDGDEVGNIELTVPANVPRWRTWAWSRNVNEPGTWSAIIRTADGFELSREQFEVEADS